MSDYLVNGVYPISYFDLDGIDEVSRPQQYWWSSKHRFAEYDPNNPNEYKAGGTRSYEVLEIDLGKTRQINYINLDIIQSPVNISIEYDVISAANGSHTWVPVKKVDRMPFDNKIFYNAKTTNPWLNADFYFTDSLGNIVNTRYLRIKFARRIERWPTRRTKPFRWPITVKNFRVARYIAGIKETQGPLFDTTATGARLQVVANGSQVSGQTQSAHLRQEFTLPSDAARGDILPGLLGFSFLVGANTGTANVVETPSWQWILRDVTDNDRIIHQGIVRDTNSRGNQQCWMDVYFDRGIVSTEINKRYAVEVWSTDVAKSNTFYYQQPNRVPGVPLPGTLDFVNDGINSIVVATDDPTDILAPGDYFQKDNGSDGSPLKVSSITYNIGDDTWEIQLDGPFTGSTEYEVTASKINPLYINGVATPEKNLVLRVMADVADVGRDVMGNQYRYATLRNEAAKVFDNTNAGWMSGPQPSPNAVESLYFDVRKANDDPERGPIGMLVQQAIDSIRIAPRTQGVTMHIYYTDHLIADRKPETIEEWESIQWTPIHETYVLRNNENIILPQRIAATFVKLEFTNLVPLPFNIPKYPQLPPVEYKRYPTWVESQFTKSQSQKSGYQKLVEDWFTKNQTAPMKKMMRLLTDPLQEFQYQQREFLAALALGKLRKNQVAPKLYKTFAEYIDTKNHALIDPNTKARIYFSTKDMYSTPLIASVDRTSFLGTAVANRFDPAIPGTQLEGVMNSNSGNRLPVVSTQSDRVSQSYAHLTQTPMWFNRKSLHMYKIERGQFNKKAYFVGIREVEFLTLDYTKVRDDDVIDNILVDRNDLQDVSWKRSLSTRIPSAENDLPNVYVSYTVGNADVTDEPVSLKEFAPVSLSRAGQPAMRIRVHSAPNQQGAEYYRGEDYDVSFTTDDLGQSVTNIARSSLHDRWTVPRDPVRGFVTGDADIVTGIAGPSSEVFGEDYGVVAGFAQINSVQLFDALDASAAVAVAQPSSTDEASMIDVDQTVIGVAEIITADEGKLLDDFNSTSGISSISAVENHNAVDSAHIIAQASVSYIEALDAVDFNSPTGVANPSAVELVARDYYDFNTVTGTSAISAVESLGSQYTDASTVFGTSAPSANEFKTSNYVDASVISGTAQISANESKTSIYIDAATVSGTSVISAVESISEKYIDAATITGVSAPSGYEFRIPNGSYAATVLSDNPIAYYRMDDSSGTRMTDIINPSMQSGTYVGSPTLGVTGATTDGNTAVSFGSSNTSRYSLIPAVAALHPSGTVFSFECWIKFNSGGGSGRLMDMGLNDFCVEITAGVFLALAKDTSASTSNSLAFTNTGVPSSTTVWSHIVAVKNGPLATDNKLYINGVEATYGGRFVQTITPNTSSQISFVRSVASGTRWVSAQLDEVAFYNTALSAAQVAAHYAAK